MKPYVSPTITTTPNALSLIQSSTIKQQVVQESSDSERFATSAAYEADE